MLIWACARHRPPRLPARRLGSLLALAFGWTVAGGSGWSRRDSRSPARSKRSCPVTRSPPTASVHALVHPAAAQVQQLSPANQGQAARRALSHTNTWGNALRPAAAAGLRPARPVRRADRGPRSRAPGALVIAVVDLRLGQPWPWLALVVMGGFVVVDPHGARQPRGHRRRGRRRAPGDHRPPRLALGAAPRSATPGTEQRHPPFAPSLGPSRSRRPPRSSDAGARGPRWAAGDDRHRQVGLLPQMREHGAGDQRALWFIGVGRGIRRGDSFRPVPHGGALVLSMAAFAARSRRADLQRAPSSSCSSTGRSRPGTWNSSSSLLVKVAQGGPGDA